MKYLPLLVCFLVACIFSPVLSQDSFQRIYQTTNESYLALSMDGIGGDYLALSLDIDDEGRYPKVNLTRFDNKGNVLWSNTYAYLDSVFIERLGEVVATEDDGIAFSALLVKDGLNKVVTKLDGQGNVQWSALTGKNGDSFSLNEGRSNLANANFEALVHCNAVENEQGSSDILVTALDFTGNVMWGSVIAATDTTDAELLEFVRDVKVLSDSSVLLAGNIALVDHQLFLTKLDSSGNLLWTKSYKGEFGSGIDQSVMAITELPGGDVVILGAQAGITTTGFVLQVDESGNYIQSKTVQAVDGDAYEYFPTSIVALKDTTVGIGFKRLNSLTGEVRPLVLHYDLDSVVAFQGLLRESTDEFIDQSGLIAVDSLTLAFLTSVDTMERWIPYLSKFDEGGGSFCGELVEYLSFDSSYFSVDTPLWTMDELIEIDTISVQQRSYGGFNPPVLSLQDTAFCPQDPVFYVVDATVEGAVLYQWDDNSTDSIRVFTEEGMYSVTVTVGKDICFQLCDTTNITVNEFPTAAIAQNASIYCETGQIFLSVASNNPIEQITWSTGESTPIITVTELVTYSVTIVDNCGNTAQADIDLSDSGQMNNPVIQRSDEDLCVDNTILLSVPDLDPANLIWSTGQTGVSFIRVSEAGTYTVQNLEQFCPGESSIVINENDFVQDLTAQITDVCSNPIQLQLAGTGIDRWIWSDGSSGAFLNIFQPGTYSVTVFDVCDESLEVSIDISPERVNECIPPPEGEPCLSWPNAIFPASNIEVNKSFGPKNDCLILDDYELRIYNRWGKNIYTSTDVNIRWSGQIDGENAPPDVYFYWARYSVGSSSFTDEGDITLIR